MKRIFFTLTLLTFTLAMHAQSWTNINNGPGSGNLGNGDDSAVDLAVDENGYVFVTGSSVGNSGLPEFATIKYSNAGAVQWVKRYRGLGVSSPVAMALDTNGNVLVTGSSGTLGGWSEFATVKYSSAGALLWTNLYLGPGFEAQARSVAVDFSGDVLVTGHWFGDFGGGYATLKYSGTGTPLWTNLYSGPNGGGPGANDADPAAVAVDGSGNVFVTGWSTSASAYFGYATIKYSSAGVPMWTNRYNGPVDFYAEARALAVDGDGNVFVTGRSVDSNYDGLYYVTIKYSNTGTPVWTNRLGGPDAVGYNKAALAVDGNGDVFVTGTSASGYVTLKYSGAGVALWTNRYDDGLESSYEKAARIAVDDSGDAFLTGTSFSSSSSNDWVTIKYSSFGVALWTNRYDGPANGDDYANSIAVDGSGNVFVTGQSWNGTSFDYVTIKYAAPRSVSLDGFAPDPTGGSYPEVRALAIQPDGNILVGGAFDILAGQTRGYLGRVQPDGSLDTSFQPPTNPHVSVWILGLMPDGSITSDLEAGSRILPKGSQSPLPGAYYMIGMASLPDGRVLITDAISPMQAVLRRLNADGSEDNSFQIPLAEGTGFVPALLAQPDGAILVGFSADLTGTQNPNSITRILTNGTVDPGFHAETDDGVATMVLQADGKIVIGGSFTQVNGVPRQHLARLNPNGTLDDAFNSAVVPGGGAGPIFSLALQTDGRILVGGDFSNLAGQPCTDLGRLNPDGSFDPSFNLSSDNFVMAMAIEQDGNVLVGGRFTNLGGQPRSSLGRILNTESAKQSLTIGGSSITWLRGGSGPEVWTTTFEVSSDGTNWTQLGVGTRISGGWQLSGIPVPAGSQVRARGYVTGGAWNASSWYVESRATVGIPRPSLSITRTEASTLTISWPSPSTGWSLEQNTTLTGGTWITPPEPIDDNGNTKSITVNADTGSRFFRLAQ